MFVLGVEESGKKMWAPPLRKISGTALRLPLFLERPPAVVFQSFFNTAVMHLALYTCSVCDSSLLEEGTLGGKTNTFLITFELRVKV